MKYQFHRRDIEKTGLDCTTFLFKNTDLQNQIDKFCGFKTDMLKVKLQSINLETLQNDTREKFKTFGWYGFTHSNFKEADFGERSKFYGGLGITYNPYNWQGVENPHLHVLGDKRYNLGTIFCGEKGRQLWDKLIFANLKDPFYQILCDQGLKCACQMLVAQGVMNKEDVQDAPHDPKAKIQRGVNTYSDTLAFNQLTPAAKSGYLGECLKKIKSTIVRSRLVELKSESKAELHWHSDERLYICTRINIPITSNVQQRIFTEENNYEVELGYYYSWDTGTRHKVEITGKGSRVNIVLGVSPWFDFHTEDQYWSSNEYYGKIHPQEMLKKNIIGDF